jgi:hypothetical protein
MFIEMLDSTFYGIYRDIGNAVKSCNTDDYAAIDRIVVDTFHKTDKPYEVPQKLWDELLETFRIGIEVGLGLNDNIDDVMHSVIARVSRHVVNRIIACIEQHEAHKRMDEYNKDLWQTYLREGSIKLIGIDEHGKNIYQAV